MTRRNAAILVFLSCALAGGAFWRFAQSDAPRETVSLQSPAPGASAVSQVNAGEPAAPAVEASAQDPLREAALTQTDTAYGAYMDELTLGDRVAQFIANRDRMSAPDRQQEADALLSQIAALEAGGGLIKAQSIFLKAAIYDALDPQAGEDARRALIESLKEEPQSERDPYERDARYKELKRREKEIINEALTLSHFPGGLTREEYLQEKLTALSRDIYGADADKSD